MTVTPAVEEHDPLAVAIGNASLLGIGYLMLGRRLLAALNLLITVGLLVLLTTVARTLWFEIVVAVWWVAVIAHGWFLARRGLRRVDTGQRILAVAVTLVVLAAFGLLRFDAARIEQTVLDARGSGDCAPALTATDRVWVGHRLADSPLVARVEPTRPACRQLQLITSRLDGALGGSGEPLAPQLDGLTRVLADTPGHNTMVDKVLDRFIDGLPGQQPCRIVELTDQLRKRQQTGNAVDRTTDAVGRVAPSALLRCGDETSTRDWKRARQLYQQVLDQYPGHELTATAQEGVQKATLAIELANVRELLAGTEGTQPPYCSSPAQYSGAAPYAKGPTRAMVFGNAEYSQKLPPEWRATDATDTVLVVCAGSEEYGDPVQTCPYTSNGSLRGFPTQVTFHKIAIPVRAFELRTGKLVAETKVMIGGASCPEKFDYSSYIADLGPPSDQYVLASDNDIRAGFAGLLSP